MIGFDTVTGSERAQTDCATRFSRPIPDVARPSAPRAEFGIRAAQSAVPMTAPVASDDHARRD